MTARKRTHYSTSEITTIREMAGDGRSDREIARALGRSSKTQVGTVRRANGIPSGQNRRFTLTEDATIREAVAAGRSSREIAAQIGRTAAAVQIRRTTQLVEVPHRGPRQIAAEARRDAHIARLRERREARRAAERQGVEA